MLIFKQDGTVEIFRKTLIFRKKLLIMKRVNIEKRRGIRKLRPHLQNNDIDDNHEYDNYNDNYNNCDKNIKKVIRQPYKIIWEHLSILFLIWLYFLWFWMWGFDMISEVRAKFSNIPLLLNIIVFQISGPPRFFTCSIFLNINVFVRSLVPRDFFKCPVFR